jgi:hypothetical protein
MKFTIALPLAFAALGLAAPTEFEKRLVGQLTLFKGASYTGQSISLNVDTNVNGGCVPVPSGFNNQVVSVRINPQQSTFYCRLFDNTGCNPSTNTENDSWFFFEDIPNLGTSANKASSILCGVNA